MENRKRETVRMTLIEYLRRRRQTVEGTIATERLAGNQFKESCEKTALAEITAMECAIGSGEIHIEPTEESE